MPDLVSTCIEDGDLQSQTHALELLCSMVLHQHLITSSNLPSELKQREMENLESEFTKRLACTALVCVNRSRSSDLTLYYPTESGR